MKPPPSPLIRRSRADRLAAEDLGAGDRSRDFRENLRSFRSRNKTCRDRVGGPGLPAQIRFLERLPHRQIDRGHEDIGCRESGSGSHHNFSLRRRRRLPTHEKHGADAGGDGNSEDDDLSSFHDS